MTPIVPDAGSVMFPGGGSITPDAGSVEAPGQGTGEALYRGALQGVTFGFSDELAGALHTILGTKGYRQARDEQRASNQASAEAHPLAYGGGELAGGLATPIPGLGAAKAGAGLLAHAGHAAVAGGIGGLGGSDADLTRGDFGHAIHDTVQSALIGGAIGVVAGKASQLIGGAKEGAEERAIKALSGGESKTSGAAWQKTKRMVNNPATREILSEPVQIETDAGTAATTTLEKAAGKPPAVIQEIVDTQAERINGELRPIYAKADAKNGGVSLKDYLGHLDEQIAKTADMAPAEAKVYKGAINELKENAIEQWGGSAKAFEVSAGQASANPETNAALRNVIMKQAAADIRIPSEDVRAEATALQKIGFKTVDPLNPGLQTQVKRDMGNMVRDFVNDHVMQTLGGEDHSRLLSLNKRMNAWLGVGTVAAARAEKEMAGRMSLGGTAHSLLGHGSMLGAMAGVASGHPGALAIPLAMKALEHRGAAMRVAARGAAALDTRLKAVADAAAAGNPWAQRMLATLRGTPGGVARIAALQSGGGDQPATAPQPTEAPPDATLAQQ